MSIDATHPDFDAKIDDWNQMADTYAGARAVKAARQNYLPATKSMVLDGAYEGSDPGYSVYNGYLRRAVFPDLVKIAAHTMVGLIMKDPSTYVLPKAMEGLLARATNEGESLEALHRRILLAQLTKGRFGLAVDVAEDVDLPYFVGYEAESITNWDTFSSPGQVNNLSFVITREEERSLVDGFSWDTNTVYRALILDEQGTYATYTEQDGNASSIVRPSFNGRNLDFIPFNFIGALDLVPTPGTIPLLGISNSALSIYTGEADFRQTLHMLGQDTLVVMGVAPGGEEDDDQEETRVGANAILELPEGGDAKYVGINGNGLTEQRQALSDDYQRAAAEGSRLLENTAAQAESGEALKVRVAAKTTTLTAVSIAAAAGLEAGLKNIARFMGIDPNEVRVEPNTDFVQDSLPPQEVLALVQAKNEGAPLSFESIHEYLRNHDYTDLNLQEELALMAGEAEVIEAIKASRIVEPTDPTGSQNEGNEA